MAFAAHSDTMSAEAASRVASRCWRRRSQYMLSATADLLARAQAPINVTYVFLHGETSMVRPESQHNIA